MQKQEGKNKETGSKDKDNDDGTGNAKCARGNYLRGG